MAILPPGDGPSAWPRDPGRAFRYELGQPNTLLAPVAKIVKTKRRCCRSGPRCKRSPVGQAPRLRVYKVSQEARSTRARPQRWAGLAADRVPHGAVPSSPMSTCLVTGGAGFLGRTSATSSRRGHRVICVDNLETGRSGHRAHPRARVRVPQRRHSSRTWLTSRRRRLPPRLARSPIDYLRLPLHTLKVGSYGTHHTLGLAKPHRARFLLASTSEVYGDPQGHPQTEDYWGHVPPRGPRGASTIRPSATPRR